MMEPGFYNMDCMTAMKDFPDKFFDLAVVDPPYGDCGGVAEYYNKTRFGGRFDRYIVDHLHSSQRKNVERTGRQWASKYGSKIISWDTAPSEEYFQELFRISKNQIIWGGNYFDLPPNRCFLVWRKLSISEEFSMAMAEYAWTSFNDNAKVYEATPQGTVNNPRFHPTQKPVALYSWILNKYAKDGDKIIDTHCGSASSLIACERAGLQYWGFEIDPEYYKKANERLQEEKNKIRLF